MDLDLTPSSLIALEPARLRAHHRFWPSRLPHAITPPATSLWDNLETSARRYPHKAALVFFGRVLSYAQLLQKAERLAACGFHIIILFLGRQHA